MAINFKNLTDKEYNLLLQFPIYVSLLAANTDGKLDHAEALSAADFAHIKSYDSNTMMANFYREVDANFKKHFK